ncbi:hypothetical protein K7W42_07270 [Deinococcus sp. HMF7604]|uniref:hypothetical protein n=1 Tax=Deinococcus betulae TaxID=2873312 RepID=UPI001CD005C3|nr:hypothetical protein [Deinococcus betulae]MBZ9750660.1 hypothetical protein [Deinococcus betulae]
MSMTTAHRLLLTLPLVLGLVQAQGGGPARVPPAVSAPVTAAPSPAVLNPIVAGTVARRVVRVTRQAEETRFVLAGLGVPLRVQHWPAHLSAAALQGLLVEVKMEPRPDSVLTQLTFRRSGAASPVLTLLTGVAALDDLPGTPLVLRSVEAQVVTVASAQGGASGQAVRPLRPGQRAVWQTTSGPVCITLEATVPVRADYTEAGRPPAITGYRAALTLDWSKGTACS